NLFSRRKRIKLDDGEVTATTTRAFRGLQPPVGEGLEPCVSGAEQSNTSVIYGDRFILKLIRRVEPGVNPDLEIGRYLTARGFAHTPPVAGALEYKINRSTPMTLAILQGFVRNQGDAWCHTLDRLGHFFELASAQHSRLDTAVMSPLPLLDRLDLPVPKECEELIGPYLGSLRLIGQRTAQLHICLASETDDPEFTPESFSKLYQRSLYQSMRALVGKTFPLLRQTLSMIPQDDQAAARTVIGLEKSVLERFRSVLSVKINALRIRCHGDYHLGQVLYTGKDFRIIDFEGEPARPLSERKIKRSPLRDVAGMLRSFHYAAHSALQTQEDRGLVNGFGRETLDSCARFWYYWVCPVFLKAYFEAAEDKPFLPETREERQILLDTFLLEKAIYELAYELNNRPAWAKIPLQGILQLTEGAA
ncbi:MAG: putative maltokinase, partial [Desulfobacterales bacterium]|nr:putative maltokinase [Desulfobacterales bacterium]